MLYFQSGSLKRLKGYNNELCASKNLSRKLQAKEYNIFFQIDRLLWSLFMLGPSSRRWSGFICYVEGSGTSERVNEVTLMCVPGHQGLLAMTLQTGSRGLVQLASSLAQNLRELSASQFREVVYVWEWEEISLYWIEATVFREAYRLITPLANKVESLMLLRGLELSIPTYWSLPS